MQKNAYEPYERSESDTATATKENLMNNDMKKFLYQTFDAKSADDIIKRYSARLDEMCREQESRLSPTQLKVARKIILTRIAFYLSMKKRIDSDEALSHTAELFYKKTKGVSKLTKFLSKYEWGCALFRKAFSIVLRADIWISEIKETIKTLLYST